MKSHSKDPLCLSTYRNGYMSTSLPSKAHFSNSKSIYPLPSSSLFSFSHHIASYQSSTASKSHRKRKTRPPAFFHCENTEKLEDTWYLEDNVSSTTIAIFEKVCRL